MKIELEVVDLGGLGPVSAKLDRLPVAAAIYSFSPNVMMREDCGSEESLEQLRQLFDREIAPNRQVPIGPYFQVALCGRSGIRSSFVEHPERARRLLENEPFRRYVNRLLELAQRLTPPLYVGETQNLQQRIRDHIEVGSLLRDRLDEAGIAITDTVLQYFTVDSSLVPVSESKNGRLSENAVVAMSLLGNFEDDSEVEKDSEAMTFIEELLSRIWLPQYIDRLGSKVVGGLET